MRQRQNKHKFPELTMPKVVSTLFSLVFLLLIILPSATSEFLNITNFANSSSIYELACDGTEKQATLLIPRNAQIFGAVMNTSIKNPFTPFLQGHNITYTQTTNDAFGHGMRIDIGSKSINLTSVELWPRGDNGWVKIQKEYNDSVIISQYITSTEDVAYFSPGIELNSSTSYCVMYYPGPGQYFWFKISDSLGYPIESPYFNWTFGVRHTTGFANNFAGIIKSIGINETVFGTVSGISVEIGNTNTFTQYTGDFSSAKIYLNNNSELQNLLSQKPYASMNLSCNATSTQSLLIDLGHTINWTGQLNLTFSNATNIQLINGTQGGKYYTINAGEELVLNYSQLSPYEDITINFLNKTPYETGKTGWYQSIQFYNNLNESLIENVYISVPDREYVAYMQAPEGRIPGHIEIYRVNPESGHWEIMNRLKTAEGNNEIRPYLEADHTYMFVGTSEGYSQTETIIEHLTQGTTTAVKVPMTSTTITEQTTVTGCGPIITNLSNPCILRIETPQSTIINIDIGWGTHNLTNTTRNLTYTIYPFLTIPLYINNSYHWMRANVTSGGTIIAKLETHYQNLSLTETGIDKDGYKRTAITVPPQLKEEYRHYMLGTIIIFGIILSAIILHVKQKWGAPSFLVWLGIWATQFWELYIPLILIAGIFLWNTWLKKLVIGDSA